MTESRKVLIAPVDCCTIVKGRAYLAIPSNLVEYSCACNFLSYRKGTYHHIGFTGYKNTAHLDGKDWIIITSIQYWQLKLGFITLSVECLHAYNEFHNV